MISLQPDCVHLAGRRGEEIITDDPGQEVSRCVSAALLAHEDMIPCGRNQCFVGFPAAGSVLHSNLTQFQFLFFWVE